jgi:hypothetical protein
MGIGFPSNFHTCYACPYSVYRPWNSQNLMDPPILFFFCVFLIGVCMSIRIIPHRTIRTDSGSYSGYKRTSRQFPL